MCWIQDISVILEGVHVCISYNSSCIRCIILKVWQYIEDASLMVLAKNNNNFCTGIGIDHGKVVGTQLNTAGVSYTLLPWLPLLLCSVKYEQKEWLSSNRPMG